MKVIRKIQVEEDHVDDVLCNQCGESCIPQYGPCPEGLIGIEIHGGYGSEHIEDGVTLKFDLCEKCVVKLILSFKIQPEFSDRDAVRHADEDTYEEWLSRKQTEGIRID